MLTPPAGILLWKSGNRPEGADAATGGATSQIKIVPGRFANVGFIRAGEQGRSADAGNVGL